MIEPIWAAGAPAEVGEPLLRVYETT